LYSHLTAVSGDIELRLKPQLTGLAGMMIKPYLPQSWVFETESETVSLVVDAQGNVSAVRGAASRPDVTIATSHARLEAALRTRDASQVPPGPLTVTPHTGKGRTAFEFLRPRLGL
ncbi:MAG: hypothetical protein ACHP93_07355, partial [Solirubrobacterales bacterium]